MYIYILNYYKLSVSKFFFININLYFVGFIMCWKKVKNKISKNNKKSSQGRDIAERELWRPYNPWPLP